MLHGEEAARAAEETAKATFGGGGIGGELPTLETDDDDMPIVSILIGLGFVDSKAEARRKIGEGAVRVNGDVVSDPMSVVATEAEPVKISLGKKKHGLFIRS
jgi:tyrosyl-tRNA synthetase